MKILVTGATGFLGSAIANRAKARGHAVRGLARESSNRSRLNLTDDEIAVGDMGEPDSLWGAAAGMEAVIHCAATTSASTPDWERSRLINVTGTERLLDACRTNSVPRFIQISSQSATPENPSVYGRTKYEADQQVRASRLDWTILKPALIYGPGKAGVFEKVVEFTRKFPVVPVLGNGKNEQCPAHVEEIAWAALECLDRPETIGKTYGLGGAEVLEFNDLLRVVMEAQCIRKRLVHLPLPLCMLLARVLGLVSKNPPVTVDNVLGVKFAPHVDNTAAERDLGYKPKAFSEGARELLKSTKQTTTGA